MLRQPAPPAHRPRPRWPTVALFAVLALLFAVAGRSDLPAADPGASPGDASPGLSDAGPVPRGSGSAPREAKPVLRDLAVLVDPAGKETLTSVLAAEPECFTPLPSGILVAGYTRRVHWLRFTLDAPAGEWILDILPPYLDDLRLYEPDADRPGVFSERRAGFGLPLTAGEIPYRGFAFRLVQPDDQPRTFFLRLATTGSSILVPRLWAPAAFHANATLEASLLLAGLAVLLTVMLLALNHWFWLRDPLSPWFLAYVGCLFLNLLGGFGFVAQYLFPDSPLINRYWLGVFALGAIAFGNGFYRLLFNIDRRHRLLYRLYWVGTIVPLLGIPPVLLGYRTEVISPLLNAVILMNGIGLYLSLRLWWRREPGSGFMLSANLLSMLGILETILHLLGYIQAGLSPLYSLHVASLGTVLALYLAIGARYRGLQEERLRAQDRARRAQAEADQERAAREEQSGLFAMISHEIKTPLTMIDGAVQSLQALVPPAPEVDRRHERIRRAVSRINALVEKTLEYDRIGHETQSLERRVSLDLGRLTQSVIAGYGLPVSRLTLRLAGPVPVIGTPGLIEVLLANLVDNALKYSPEDTQVSVTLGTTGPTAILEVRDRGPGIPPSLRPILFDRYVRGRNVGDITGAGLGLYLVRRIARWHDGEVECLERKAGGACLRVTLPLSPRRETA